MRKDTKLESFIGSLREKSRLRKKLLYYFFFAGVIPLILMGIAGMYLINRTHRIDISTIETKLAEAKAAEIEKLVGAIVSTFNIQVAFEQFSQIRPEDQKKLLAGLMQDKMGFREPPLLEIAFLCLTERECAPGKETSKMYRAGSEFEFAREENLLDHSENPKFLEVKQGNHYIGEVNFTYDRGPVVTVAAPVKNGKKPNPDIIAVLAGEISLKEIQERLQDVKLGAKGYVYITEKSRKIIAHSRGIGIGEYATPVGIAHEVVVGKAHTGLAKEDLYESLWGERVIGAGQRIGGTASWAVIVEWPLEDAQSVVRTMRARIAQFAIGALLLVVTLASFVAWQLVGPISILEGGAKIIGEGNFDYRIQLRTGDEIEELGHSLNKMAENLKQLEELHELKLKTQYLAESLAKEKEFSKLKDQFISVASHQLYTPLSVIGWTIEGIAAGEVPKEALAEGLRTIDRGRKDLLEIANDLLTISEIGFHYEKKKSEMFSIEAIVKNIVIKRKKDIEAKKLSLDLKVLAADTTADVNQFTIEKSIDHLVANAITYSHDGGKISVLLDGDEREVRFTIKDEGIGIPKDEHEMVFTSFFRAKNAVEKRNVGTGLGLFIAKTIIDGHGGRITFESEQNKGATFTFALPRK